MNEIFHAQWIKAKKNGKMNAVSFIKTRSMLSFGGHVTRKAWIGWRNV